MTPRPGQAAAHRWLASLLAAACVGAQAAAPETPQVTVPDAATVLQSAPVTRLLDRTAAWYRELPLQQGIATDPSDLAVLADNRLVTDQIVRLAFQFARAAGEFLDRAEPTQAAVAGGSQQYRSLVTLQGRLSQQARDTEAELARVRERLAHAEGASAQTLQSQANALQSQLALDQARRDAVQAMLDFQSGSSANGLGGTGLRSQIEALAGSVGALAANTPTPSNSASAPAASAPAARATINAPARSESSSIVDSVAQVYTLARKIDSVEQLMRQTDDLRHTSKATLDPFVKLLQTYSQLGDTLGGQSEGTDAERLAHERAQLDALVQQFKQVANAVMPLAEQGVLIDQYTKNLVNWRSSIRDQYRAALRALALRLGILAVLFALLFGASELWRRVVVRYIHEPRRLHQLLVVRRLVLWLGLGIIIASAFASRLDSFVTFAGLLTAGIAVALQNVILSVVGYFFLIGKYGVRVGDHVQIGEVLGEVLDLGLVRLHLMELSRTGAGPTGRVVAFSNSIVFQAAGGLFKQLPGVQFSWHEITLVVAAQADYGAIKTRLIQAVEAGLSQHKREIERQSREMARLGGSAGTDPLQPSVRLKFTAAGIEATARYPVDMQHGAEIDEAVSQELLRALDQAPSLRLAGSAEGLTVKA